MHNMDLLYNYSAYVLRDLGRDLTAVSCLFL